MRTCDLIKDQDTYQAELGHTVLETVRVMVERNIGAVPVLHNGKLVGIFSERDLMKRVVAEGPRSPQYLYG
jgi:CBS domain-containing protein